MRSTLLLIIISFIFSSTTNAMTKLVHFADKSIDPVTYATQGEAIDHCIAVLKLDPEHSEHLEFENTTKWTDPKEGHLSKIARRHIQLLYEIEGSIFGLDERWFWIPTTGIHRTPNDSTTKLIIVAAKQIAGCLSNHALTVLKADIHGKHKGDSEQISILEGYLPLRIKSYLPQSSSPSPKPAYKDPVPYGTFKEWVLKDRVTWYEAFNNFVRKNYANELVHLQHNMTQIFSTQLQRYDPDHPGHDPFFNMDPQNAVQKQHVHNTFERERILSSLVTSAILNDCTSVILAIDPSNSNNTVTVSKDYFPPVLRAMIIGYMRYKNNEKRINPGLQLISNPFEICSCKPPRFLKDCLLCTAELRKKSSNSSTPQLRNTCSCNPPNLLENCKKCLDEKDSGKPKNLHPYCNCEKHPKPLQECILCSATLKQLVLENQPTSAITKQLTAPASNPPASQPKIPTINLEDNCWCKPPKKLKTCEECLKKRVQQLQQK